MPETLVLVPTRVEARRLRALPVHLTGVGAAAAVGTLDRLAASLQPDRIIAAGFAGGLDPALRVGEVIRPSWVVNDQGERVALPEGDGRTLLSVDRVLHVGEKRAWRDRSGAAIVDMETFALACRARVLGIRFVSLRCVSDPASFALPAESVRWVRSNGSSHVGRVLRWLCVHPHRLPMVMRLGRYAAVASARLGEAVLQELAPELGRSASLRG